MDQRRLAGTDLDVSVVMLRPDAGRKEPGDDRHSQAGARALHAALDCGIDFVHSSYE
jgi:hypothetical protein